MSDPVPSRIEDLANELWLDIFDYLDWINLFSAFYGINTRINQLLMSIKRLSLYSSYLLNHSDIIYIFFKEFPLNEFKQIRHFQLIYDNPYETASKIIEYLPSFSNLVSLSINANRVNLNSNDKLAMIWFRQHCPLLQRLYLNGNILDQNLQIKDNISMFYCPSLLYLHVNRLHFMLAIQLLDQCPQLRSFSTILDGDSLEDSTMTPSVLIPTRISMGLTPMKKLCLVVDDFYKKPFILTFLELLLPCCPNLCTFSYDYYCYSLGGKPLDPDWWARVLVSNSKLKHIALRLYINGALHYLHQDVVQRFQFLPFFAQLNVNVTYTIHRTEFPHMSHNYAITN